jgi:hypothetical protein
VAPQLPWGWFLTVYHHDAAGTGVQVGDGIDTSRPAFSALDGHLRQPLVSRKRIGNSHREWLRVRALRRHRRCTMVVGHLSRIARRFAVLRQHRAGHHRTRLTAPAEIFVVADELVLKPRPSPITCASATGKTS